MIMQVKEEGVKTQEQGFEDDMTLLLLYQVFPNEKKNGGGGHSELDDQNESAAKV